MNMEESVKKQYAFISYSHKDIRTAKRLQRWLESYKLPTTIQNEFMNSRYLRPVVRDGSDFGAGELNEEITRELSDSKFLIVICSRNSASSYWVNKEVKLFLDMGRSRDIIPYIVGRRDGEDVSEFFPDVLREYVAAHPEKELLGVDEASAGRRMAFVRTVARMLGLEFGELWDRYARQRRRRYAVYSVLGVISMCALVVLIDFARVKKEYFVDYVVRYGMPEGIFPVQRNELDECYKYYRFESRYGKLRRVVACNIWGSVMEETGTSSTDRAAILELGYEDGVFTSVTRKNSTGKVFYKEDYSPDFTKADLKNQLSGDEANMAGSSTSIRNSMTSGDFDLSRFFMNANSKIARYVYEYDFNGFVVRKMYKKYNGSNEPGYDKNGIYGIEYVRDDYGRILEMYYLDEDGDRTEDRYGVAGRRFTYDDATGFQSSESYFDSGGNPCFNELKYSVGKSAWNPETRVLTEEFFGPDGQPCINMMSFSSCILSFSDNGYDVSYFGTDGAPAVYYDRSLQGASSDGGYHLARYKVDRAGRPNDMQFFGTDSLPCSSLQGAHHLVTDFDSDNRPLSVVNYGVNGNRAKVREGYAEMRYDYDDDGNLVLAQVLGQKGEPVNCMAGFSSLRQRFHDGRLVEMSAFAANGLPANALTMGSVHCLHLGYDDMGNVSKVEFLDGGGELSVSPTLQYAYAELEYDNGNCVEMAVFDEDGNPIRSYNNAACIRYEYDERGNAVVEKIYDENLEPGLNNMNYSMMEADYDKYGNIVEQRSFGTDGEPVVNSDGWAVKKMEYWRGFLISVAAFNPEGRPVRAAQLDAHRIRYSYNPAGYVESIAYFGTGDEPVVSREGFHKVSNAYDTFGRIAEMSFYDVNGLPTENIYGFFRAENEYDDYGRHLGVSYYDTSGDLTICRQPGYGYASYRNTYDKYGNLVESAAFGEEMEPVNADAGFSRMVSLYNENSQLLMIACYDKDGNLVPAPQSGGNAKSKSIYNADGYLEASIMFDPDNRITTSIYNTVDERGQLISTMMLDHAFGDLSRYDAITGEMEVFYANSYEDDAGKVRREEEYRHLMDSIETLAVDLYE